MHGATTVADWEAPKPVSMCTDAHNHATVLRAPDGAGRQGAPVARRAAHHPALTAPVDSTHCERRLSCGVGQWRENMGSMRFDHVIDQPRRHVIGPRDILLGQWSHQGDVGRDFVDGVERILGSSCW